MKRNAVKALVVFALAALISPALLAEDCHAISATTEETQELGNNRYTVTKSKTWSCGGVLITVTDTETRVRVNSAEAVAEGYQRDQFNNRGERTNSWEGTGTAPFEKAPWNSNWDNAWWDANNDKPPSGNSDTRLIDSSDSCSNCGW